MNYKRYCFSFKEGVLYSLEYSTLAGMTAYLFYDSIYAFFILIPGLVLFLKRKKEQLMNRRKKELCVQFQEMIAVIATALNAGFSIENAFREAAGDMQKMYGENKMIVRELKACLHLLSINQTLESFLQDFAERTDIEDIRDFSMIFSMAKRNGGNFNKIIQRSIGMMRSKRETEKEIEVLLSGKQFEQKIMSLIPFFIIGYLRWNTGSFLSVLYHNPIGVMGMSLCLLLYAAAFLLAEKIVKIDV